MLCQFLIWKVGMVLPSSQVGAWLKEEQDVEALWTLQSCTGKNEVLVIHPVVAGFYSPWCPIVWQLE